MNNGNSESPFQISQKYEMPQPETLMFFPLWVDEWEDLKDRIDSISKKTGFIYNSIGISFITFSLSCIVALFIQNTPLSFNKFKDLSFIIFLFVFLLFFVVGFFLLIISKIKRKMFSDSIESITKQMDLIQKRWIKKSKQK